MSYAIDDKPGKGRNEFFLPNEQLFYVYIFLWISQSVILCSHTL